MTISRFRGFSTTIALTASLAIGACDGGSGVPDATEVSRAKPLAKFALGTGKISLNAQPLDDRYAADAKRVEDIIKWTGSTWSFISGARSAVDFLTGLDGQNPISIQDIRSTVVDALQDEALTQLKLDIDGFMNRYHQMQVLALDQVMSGQSKETLMTSAWGTTHLRDIVTVLIHDGTDLFQRLDPTMRAVPGQASDRRVAAATAAYTVLVPALISVMRLATEIDPTQLKRGYDQLVSETLVTAQQTLFNAAGAYLIYAYDPARGPARFYSPVGADTDGWMLDRPLYRYHYVDPYGDCSTSSKLPRNTTGCFSGPHDPFFRYQAIPIVSLALDSLERTTNTQHAMVMARNVYIWDLYSSPTKPGDNVAQFAFGDIVRVRQ